MEIKKLVVLLLEQADIAIELLQNSTDVLEVVLLKGPELLNCSKKLDQL